MCVALAILLVMGVVVSTRAQRADHTVTVVEEIPSTGLHGQVVDPDGAPIGGASLTYIGPGMRVRETVLTGPDGGFQLRHLEPGTYVITVSAEKYRPRHDLTCTVVAGAMSPTQIMLVKTPGFFASLLRAGFPQGWVAAVLTMLLVARVGRSRWTSDREPNARLGVRPLVGGCAGLLVGIAVTLTAPTAFELVANSLLATEHGSLAWAPQFAKSPIVSIAAFGAPMIGLVVSAAPGVAVSLSPTASGLGALRNNLGYDRLPGAGSTEALYVAMVVVGSGLIGMLVGLCVSYAVSFLHNRRVTSGVVTAPPST